jgi:hypothetical protein
MHFSTSVGLALILATAACVAAPPEDSCGALAQSNLVGAPVSAAQGFGVGRTVRILYPDTARTEDFSPGRLNVEVGYDGIITSFWCG